MRVRTAPRSSTSFFLVQMLSALCQPRPTHMAPWADNISMVHRAEHAVGGFVKRIAFFTRATPNTIRLSFASRCQVVLASEASKQATVRSSQRPTMDARAPPEARGVMSCSLRKMLSILSYCIAGLVFSKRQLQSCTIFLCEASWPTAPATSLWAVPETLQCAIRVRLCSPPAAPMKSRLVEKLKAARSPVPLAA